MNPTGRALKIRNKKDFITNYNKIFTPSFRLKILDSVPHNMDAKHSYRSSGVMLGGGIIWFGFDGKVKSINNGCYGEHLKNIILVKA